MPQYDTYTDSLRIPLTAIEAQEASPKSLASKYASQNSNRAAAELTQKFEPLARIDSREAMTLSELCSCCHLGKKPHTPEAGCHSPLDACCGNFCPDIKAAGDPSDRRDMEFHSPAAFHRRSSTLSQQQWPEDNTVEAVIVPQKKESAALSPEEKAEILEFQRSQQEDDQIQFELESEGEDMGGTGIDHRVKYSPTKEKDSTNGGWMDRSL